MTTAEGAPGLRSEVDAGELLRSVGIDADEIEWRKDFVGFDEADEERLAELSGLFEDLAQDLPEGFYDHLQAREETTAVLERSERSVEALKGTQQRYLESLGPVGFDGEPDVGHGETYFRQRAVIGKIHSLLDMPAHHYIGMYAFYHEALVDALVEEAQTAVAAALTEALPDADSGDQQSQSEPSLDESVGTDNGAEPDVGAEEDHPSGAGSEDGSASDAPAPGPVADEDAVTAAAESVLDDLRDQLLAVLRVTNLDLQVAMDTYTHTEEEDVWLNALETLPTPMLVIDENADIRVMNDQLEDLLGLSRERAEEMELYEVFRTNETHDTTTTAIEHSLGEETAIYDEEYEVLNHRDELLKLRISNAPMYDPDDDLIGAVAGFRDITKLREQQERLNETQAHVAEELGGLVEEGEATAATLSERASDIETAATEQHESLTGANDDLQSFSARMEEVAASTEQVADLSHAARADAEEGVEAATSIQAATSEVADQTESLVETVEALAENIDTIDEVVQVIEDVADQTNILALNAGIEAAHADDAGGGFAVVADEVKALAEETREQTQAIRQQTGDIQDKTAEAVEAVERTQSEVESVHEESESARASFERVDEQIDEATDGIDEIARATEEQAETVQELVEVIEDVADQATGLQDDASGVEEVASDLATLAERLGESVDELTTDLEGQ